MMLTTNPRGGKRKLCFRPSATFSDASSVKDALVNCGVLRDYRAEIDIINVELRVGRGRQVFATAAKESRTGMAIVEFSTADCAAAAFERYRDLNHQPIGPAGWHHAGPHDGAPLPKTAVGADIGWEPSLKSQLWPLRVPEICSRLSSKYPSATIARICEQEKCHGGRFALLDILTEMYESGAITRKRKRAQGVPVPEALCSDMLEALRSANWGKRERKLRSDEYLTLKRLPPLPQGQNPSKRRMRTEKFFKKHKYLWDCANAIMKACAPPDYTFTCIAITRNFRGSPHRDRLDQTYQFTLSLGEFGEHGGGRLCVESADGKTVCEIDTYKKLGCIVSCFH